MVELFVREVGSVLLCCAVFWWCFCTHGHAFCAEMRPHAFCAEMVMHFVAFNTDSRLDSPQWEALWAVRTNNLTTTHSSMHVSQKHSHCCHCTAGDINDFSKCTALTSVNLYSCRKLIGKIRPRDFLLSGTPQSARKQALNLRPQHSCIPVMIHHTTPALLCGLVVCVLRCALIRGYVTLAAFGSTSCEALSFRHLN